MTIALDWLSFTLDVGEHQDNDWFYNQIDKACTNNISRLWKELRDNTDEWTIGTGRPPYRSAYDTGVGIKLYFGKPNNILIEISGKGCQWLRDQSLMDYTIGATADKVTRVDIAIDMVVNTNPEVFAETRSNKRQRAFSTINSATGTTCYIGSRKSLRYARVYRYSEPHPRSNLLRVEMVFRKQEAKTFAELIKRGGMKTAAKSAGEIYGWIHPSWNIDAETIPLPSYRPDRPEGKTVRWLIAQVAPSFKRLVADGIIDDGELFLRQYFLDG